MPLHGEMRHDSDGRWVYVIQQNQMPGDAEVVMDTTNTTGPEQMPSFTVAGVSLPPVYSFDIDEDDDSLWGRVWLDDPFAIRPVNRTYTFEFEHAPDPDLIYQLTGIRPALTEYTEIDLTDQQAERIYAAIIRGSEQHRALLEQLRSMNDIVYDYARATQLPYDEAIEVLSSMMNAEGRETAQMLQELRQAAVLREHLFSTEDGLCIRCLFSQEQILANGMSVCQVFRYEPVVQFHSTPSDSPDTWGSYTGGVYPHFTVTQEGIFQHMPTRPSLPNRPLTPEADWFYGVQCLFFTGFRPHRYAYKIHYLAWRDAAEEVRQVLLEEAIVQCMVHLIEQNGDPDTLVWQCDLIRPLDIGI